jgi:hypothetical protein
MDERIAARWGLSHPWTYQEAQGDKGGWIFPWGYPADWALWNKKRYERGGEDEFLKVHIHGYQSNR